MDPLTEAQKQEFIQKGYLIVRNVIPKEMVDQALRRINHAVGTAAYNTQVYFNFIRIIIMIITIAIVLFIIKINLLIINLGRKSRV